MGWKGFVRSVGAAVRQAEREAARRERLRLKEAKRVSRLNAAAAAEREVHEWEERKDEALSAHRAPVQRVDWQTLLTRPAPSTPRPPTERSERARRGLEEYRPGVADRILGREARRRADLERALAEARAAEEEAFRQALAGHEQEKARVEAERDLAEGVLEGHPEALVEALRYHEARFDALEPLMRGVGFDLAEGRVVVDVEVEPELPFLRTTKTLLKSGALSEKETPKTRYQEWYQEAVASTALRAAAESLAILPVPAVLVHVRTDLLDLATGHLRLTPILSVAVPRASLERLNLAQADASDALSNFAHAMDFKKTMGFRPVAPLRPGAIAL